MSNSNLPNSTVSTLYIVFENPITQIKDQGVKAPEGFSNLSSKRVRDVGRVGKKSTAETINNYSRHPETPVTLDMLDTQAFLAEHSGCIVVRPLSSKQDHIRELLGSPDTVAAQLDKVIAQNDEKIKQLEISIKELQEKRKANQCSRLQ